MNKAPQIISAHMGNLNKWRTSFNPLRSLSMQRIVSMLESGERGEYIDLAWLYRFIEKRDATIRGLKHLRRSAIGNCEWTIKTIAEEDLPKGYTAAHAEKQQNDLRAAYDQIDNLEDAFAHLAGAEFRGFAHCAKVYAGKYIDDGIAHLECWDQWFFCRDGLYAPWRINPDLNQSILGCEEIDPAHWIMREVDDPIDEIALIAYLRKNMSQKDWDGFIEVFGIPAIFLIMPDNVGNDPAKLAEYQETAEAVISDARGALPAGSDVKTVGGDVRGSAPFKDHINYQDSQIVLAGTSGKLTMLNDATGMGSGQSDLHEAVFNELAQAEAREIAGIFQRAIDAPLRERLFPGQPCLAYFDFGQSDSEDIGAVLDHDGKLAFSGRRIATGDLQERTGYEIEDIPPQAQPAASPYRERNKARVANREQDSQPPSEQFLDRVNTLYMKALAADTRPLAERLAALLMIEDDGELLAALEALEKEFPEIAGQVLDGEASAQVLDDAQRTAMAAGLEQGGLQ